MLSTIRAALAVLVVLFAPAAARAASCGEQTFEGTAYAVCRFDVGKDDLRLFWNGADGQPYRTFDALAGALKEKGQVLAFAMNAGMYGDDFRPVGLYVEDGQMLVPANTKTVTGEPGQIPNFYKQPNGVFFVGKGSAGILTTDAYLKAPPAARFATQSGPMLVIGGALHPAFIEGSTDRKPRDGIGIASPTEVVFAISESPVNFYDFARFFRDGLGTKAALFLDGGSAPGLYAPELNRNDPPGHGGYGPIVGVAR